MRVETSSLARLRVLYGKQDQGRAPPWAGRQRDEEESAFILPASVSLNLTGGSKKSFRGRQTGSQQCVHAASMVAGVLFYQETDPKTGRGGYGGVPRSWQPLPR